MASGKIGRASNGLTANFSSKAVSKDKVPSSTTLLFKGLGTVSSCLTLGSGFQFPPRPWNHSNKNHILPWKQGTPLDTRKPASHSPWFFTLPVWPCLVFSVLLPWAMSIAICRVDLMRPGSGVMCSSIPITLGCESRPQQQGEWGLE